MVDMFFFRVSAQAGAQPEKKTQRTMNSTGPADGSNF